MKNNTIDQDIRKLNKLLSSQRDDIDLLAQSAAISASNMATMAIKIAELEHQVKKLTNRTNN